MLSKVEALLVDLYCCFSAVLAVTKPLPNVSAGESVLLFLEVGPRPAAAPVSAATSPKH